MNRDLKNIDRLFQENLSASGEQPPVHIWNGIENALDVADATGIANKKEKRKRFAAAAILLVTAGAAFLLITTSTDINSNAKANLPAIVSPAKQTIQQLQPVEEKEYAKIASSTVATRAALNANNKIDFVTKTENVADRFIDLADHKTIGAGTEIPQSTGNAQLSVMDAEPNAQLFSTIDIYRQNQHLENLSETLPYNNSAITVTKTAPLVQTKRPGRFSVTAFFAPDITTRNLEQNFGSTIDERKEEILRTERNSRLDFTLGARVEYKLNKHFSLQSGLSFSSNTIDIAQKTVFARFDKDGALKFRFNLSSGYAYFKPKTLSAPQFLGDSAQALSSSSTLHYINIPLMLKYNMASGRFNFSVQAGLAVRFITKQSIDAVYASNGRNEKSRTNEIQGLKTNYFNGIIGLGADYSLNKNIALTVFPSFNFATTSINRDAPVKAYPNTLSIATGIKFNL